MSAVVPIYAQGVEAVRAGYACYPHAVFAGRTRHGATPGDRYRLDMHPMHRRCGKIPLIAIATTAAVAGCALHEPNCTFDVDEEHFLQLASDISYDDAHPAGPERLDKDARPPLTLKDDTSPDLWGMSLEEAVQLAVLHSQVMRDLSGTVLRFPETVSSIYGPAVVASDPRFGVEGALSAFDAELSTELFFDKNDRAINNTFLGGGTRILRQDLANYDTRLSKRTATGTEFAIRHHVDYDANNAPGNRYASVFNTWIDGEFRQPLLQGAGLEFNRIAGPDAVPGSINGVLIARLNTDISVAEFQAALRDLISNVENAYWDLYFAYRELDARIAARDAALETWRIVKTWNEEGRRGGEAEKEAQAREQYFRFEAEVQNALTGRLLQRTQTYNGSSGGSFRGLPGVHVAERRLRLIMGIPINDGRLIRPSNEPIMARVVFNWGEIMPEALANRVELRRQRDQIRRRELDLIASKNFLLPKLDAVGRYRWRGFGQDLINERYSGKPPFDNAVGDMTTGRFQEWQLGVELSMPLGFRQGFAAVRNVQLQLARQRALLQEEERQVVLGLSGAVAEKDRAYEVTQTGYNRLVAARQQLESVQAAFDAGRAPLDLVLDAQERLADATDFFYRTQVEYALAIKNVHYEKGSLLNYNGVYLAEGPRPGRHCRCGSRSACSCRGKPPLDYVLAHPPGDSMPDAMLPDAPSAPLPLDDARTSTGADQPLGVAQGSSPNGADDGVVRASHTASRFPSSRRSRQETAIRPLPPVQPGDPGADGSQQCASRGAAPGSGP